MLQSPNLKSIASSNCQSSSKRRFVAHGTLSGQVSGSQTRASPRVAHSGKAEDIQNQEIQQETYVSPRLVQEIQQEPSLFTELVTPMVSMRSQAPMQKIYQMPSSLVFSWQPTDRLIPSRETDGRHSRNQPFVAISPSGKVDR